MTDKLLQLLLVIVGLVVALKVFLNFKRKPKPDLTLDLKEIENALSEIKQLTGFEKYLAKQDQTHFLNKYKAVYNVFKRKNKYRWLDQDTKSKIEAFYNFYHNISTTANTYNQEYTKQEISHFEDFFNTLEKYPLSKDQMTAIVTDEDNNLVVAGAGTGKTTTIAGKVAYLLKKQLAQAEEILVISFTKTAVEEMGDRIRLYLNDDTVSSKLKIKTFNSYGFEVMRTVRKKENLTTAFTDEKELYLFIQNQFKELFLTNEQYSKTATNFIAFFSRPQRDEHAFENGDDYHKYEKSFQNRGLDGKKYKSKEEVEIANFLLLNNVKYEYEYIYPLLEEDKDPTYGTYQPDFYLVDYKIYLEHFGIDRNGNVSSRLSKKGSLSAKDSYNAGMKWKREIHDKYQTKLLETYSYENTEGRLLTNLKSKLEACEVKMDRKSPEEILDIFTANEEFINEFTKLIVTFMNLMKSNKFEPGDIKKKSDKRTRVFLDVFTPIYQRYENHLSEKSMLDFNDMINQAADEISNGNYSHQFKYVLIDEFQDLSLNRYELLKSLRKQNNKLKIYAVGDDWQSIFRFTGSDISLLTKFGEYFGYYKQTEILNTYRFNSEILELTSNFIQKNNSQLKKELVALSTPSEPSFEFIGLNTFKLSYEEQRAQTHSAVKNLLDQLEKKGEAKEGKLKIFIIGRYHSSYELRNTFYKNLEISYKTAHSVKGLTCDYAILVNINSGRMGFPSEVEDDPILEYLLHEGDHYDNAEERRVFYVACTRAMHKNFIIYDRLNESKFLKEIKGDYETIKPQNNSVNCPICHGEMVLRDNQSGGQFWGCSHYPSCKGVLRLKKNLDSIGA